MILKKVCSWCKDSYHSVEVNILVKHRGPDISTTLKIPRALSENSFKEFLNEYFLALEGGASEELILTADETEFIGMAGYVLLGILIDSAKDQGCTVKLVFPEGGFLDRLRGYFSDDQTPAFERYLEKRRVKITRCFTGSDVAHTTDKVASIIKERMNPNRDVALALSWAIGELSDNAGTHGYNCYEGESFPKPVFVSAIDLDTSIEVVIADRGQGIVSSLRQIPQFAGTQKRQLLELALTNGVSGHPVFSPGFGLFSISEITKHSQGSLSIFSNGLWLKQDGSQPRDISSVRDFGGTLISLKIDKNVRLSLADIIGKTDRDVGTI